MEFNCHCSHCNWILTMIPGHSNCESNFNAHEIVIDIEATIDHYQVYLKGQNVMALLEF